MPLSARGGEDNEYVGREAAWSAVVGVRAAAEAGLSLFGLLKLSDCASRFIVATTLMGSPTT